MPRRAGRTRPKLAVFKFASCDGCQLQLLSAEAELLTLAEQVEIAYFLEASSRIDPGPYDLSLVEGSVSTPRDLERIEEIRRRSRVLVAIGACATAGGIQALRNYADVEAFASRVYARPEYVRTLAEATPISAHVRVDFELRGCPIERGQLLEVVSAFLWGRRPDLPDESVCAACKRQGLVCRTVAAGEVCLGPVTHGGCGAICPACRRGCYGCFGPRERANVTGLEAHARALGMADEAVRRLRRFTVAAFEPLRGEAADG